MPVTKLDPVTAFLAIDLQQAIVSQTAVHPIGEVVARAGALADAFRRHELPVVLVTVGGAPSGRTEQTRKMGPLAPGWNALLPELGQQPQDHTVTKLQWGAFTGTGLDDYLKSCGVTQVVIAGVATSIGVESTARNAHELGYNVTLSVDAMTDTNADAHLNSIARIFPRLGETGTTQEILDLLDRSRP